MEVWPLTAAKAGPGRSGTRDPRPQWKCRPGPQWAKRGLGPLSHAWSGLYKVYFQYFQLMTQMCAKSCNRCCVDKDETCRDKAYLCYSNMYSTLMTDACRKTCLRCNWQPPSPPPPPPPPAPPRDAWPE
ncbi:hypothetical protein AAVH_08441 [Aphelenchoides avenae]|nr:hypothetical protein AAVH_08441 [Aphelenchus avenae]